MKETVRIIRNALPILPKIAVQLGSGLGFLADLVENPIEISYLDLPGFPKPTVEGHGGKLVFGLLEGVPILFLSGRAHYYEGHPIEDVVYPVRVLHDIGVEDLLLTNAAGAVNPDYAPGDLMLISDHINFSGINPLKGPYQETDGPRFPDQSEVYNKALSTTVLRSAERAEVVLKVGVYIWFSGPTYETPAEVRMARIMGADAVGMSTVPEAMIANRLGMNVCAISSISNMAAGLSETTLTHEEVLETATISSSKIQKVLFEFLREESERYARD